MSEHISQNRESNELVRMGLIGAVVGTLSTGCIDAAKGVAPPVPTPDVSKTPDPVEEMVRKEQEELLKRPDSDSDVWEVSEGVGVQIRSSLNVEGKLITFVQVDALAHWPGFTKDASTGSISILLTNEAGKHISAISYPVTIPKDDAEITRKVFVVSPYPKDATGSARLTITGADVVSGVRGLIDANSASLINYRSSIIAKPPISFINATITDFAKVAEYAGGESFADPERNYKYELSREDKKFQASPSRLQEPKLQE